MKNLNKQINLVTQIAVITLAVSKLLDLTPDVYDLAIVLLAILVTKRLLK